MTLTPAYDPDIDSRQAYDEFIEMLVEQTVRGIEECDQPRSEAVFESVDGTRPTIYWYEALGALRYSGGPDEWKHLVDEDARWTGVLCAMAFDAIRMNVYEQLPPEDEFERPTP
jgi:hypothetical protein